jgi:Uma2 family endonuclease
MATLITDFELAEKLRAQRELWGGDRFDEVWEGTYIMNPIPNPEHMHLQGQLVWALTNALGPTSSAIVYPGINVSDREDDWRQNYRCPDVAVILPGSAARERDAYYLGGPDFVVEIVSPHDRSREKIAFYEKVGVREFLIVDRDPWQLELHRLCDGKLQLVGRFTVDQSDVVQSTILPIALRLLAGERRPQIEIKQSDSGQVWLA